MSGGQSRRPRRGRGRPVPDSEPEPLPESLDPERFRQVDDAVWSFANRRLNPVVTAIGAGFLGPARPAERKLPEIHLALRAYACLGWSDAQGNRLIDMFAAHGVTLEGELASTLAALRDAAFGLYSIESVDAGTADMETLDVLREEAFVLHDRHAAAVLDPGDQLLAWVVPSRSAWHPVGAATMVPAAMRKPVEMAVAELARSLDCEPAALPGAHPVHLFWTVFRVVNALPPGSGT